MSESIKAKVAGRSREEVTALLGKPDFGSGKAESVSYFLRNESFIVGLRYAELAVFLKMDDA